VTISKLLQLPKKDEMCGNYGLSDNGFALEWVNKHIGSFGGDISNITLGGQSAGGALGSMRSLSRYCKLISHINYKN